MGFLRHRKRDSSDVESAAATSDSSAAEKPDRTHSTQIHSAPSLLPSFIAYADGDEYELLLRYANEQAAKLSHSREDDRGEEQPDYRRLWYAPWKKVKKQSLKEKKVGPSVRVLVSRSITDTTKIPEDWLQTDMTRGLSDSDVESHRQGYGYNELSSPHENQFLKFVSYFRGPILYVMEIAVILSAGLRDWIDFGVIVRCSFLFIDRGSS